MNKNHPHWDAYQISAKLAANLFKYLPFEKVQEVALMDKDILLFCITHGIPPTTPRKLPSAFKEALGKAWLDHMEAEMVLPRDLDKLKITIELFSHFSEQAFQTFVLTKEVGES